MSAGASSTRQATMAAIVTAVAVIASQIAGKAARDAVFLSTFDVKQLPLMLMGAAVLSIVMVLVSARFMVRWSPGRVVPVYFFLSALMMLGVWGLLSSVPEVAAVLLYLLITSFGVVLISGFWSVVNERFDPHTARKAISRVVWGATLGGLLGGVLAERVAAWADVTVLLPILAGLHLMSAICVRLLKGGKLEKEPPAGSVSAKQTARDSASPWSILTRERFLILLALIVLVSTVASQMLDYVYKASVTMEFTESADLTRFFAGYYMAVGLFTFLLQSLLSKKVLEKFGPARTVSILPFATSLGSLLVMIMPRLGAAVGARFVEATLRSSMFRSGYELFFVPISPKEKRATKTIIDVGFDRLGDVIGGGAIKLVLLVPGLVLAVQIQILMGIALVLSMAGVVISVVLRRGYVQALEKSLIRQGAVSEAGDASTNTMILQTLTHLTLPGFSPSDSQSVASLAPKEAEALEKAAESPVGNLLDTSDPQLLQVAQLRSGDAALVREVLADDTLDPSLAAQVVPLLAWDAVAPQALAALRPWAGRIAGQLVDTLLNTEEEFIIRRRIPAVLRECENKRAVDGLYEALMDKRFEVRFHSVRALACALGRHPQWRPSKSQIKQAVMKELEADPYVWSDRRVLDQPDGACGVGFYDDQIGDRAGLSLQHVFSLLALIMEKEPLRVAFRGLHTSDEMLRGTSLEYLEVTLPQELKESLFARLGDIKSKPLGAEGRSAREVKDRLMKSSVTIDASLAGLAELRDSLKDES